MQDTPNTPLNILIADGDEATGVALRNELNTLGHDARWVNNGVSAVDTTRGFIPDIVIIDLDISEMDAQTVCATLREDPDLAHTIYIAQGMAPTDQLRHDLRNAGFHCLIQKPVTIDEMDKALSIRLRPSALDVFAHALGASIRF